MRGGRPRPPRLLCCTAGYTQTQGRRVWPEVCTIALVLFEFTSSTFVVDYGTFSKAKKCQRMVLFTSCGRCVLVLLQTLSTVRKQSLTLWHFGARGSAWAMRFPLKLLNLTSKPKRASVPQRCKRQCNGSRRICVRR